MAKQLRHELTYDAPMAEVAEMLADTSFREEVCDFQGVKSAMVTIGHALEAHPAEPEPHEK